MISQDLFFILIGASEFLWVRMVVEIKFWRILAQTGRQIKASVADDMRKKYPLFYAHFSHPIRSRNNCHVTRSQDIVQTRVSWKYLNEKLLWIAHKQSVGWTVCHTSPEKFGLTRVKKSKSAWNLIIRRKKSYIGQASGLSHMVHTALIRISSVKYCKHFSSDATVTGIFFEPR